MGSGCSSCACNSIVFPRPKMSTKDKASYLKCPYITYIKTRRHTQVPCIKITFPQNPKDYTLVFFHGNCEDIFKIRLFLSNLAYDLHINIICPEYQGYSIYKGKPNDVDILTDAEDVYQHLSREGGFEESHIVLVGRSLGSGPVVHLGANHNPGSVILISGFTSLRAAGRNNVGCLAGMLKDRFINRDYIHQISCPTLYIHGQRDKVVPYQHSKRMYTEQYKTNKSARCSFPILMSHNSFDFIEDYIIPIQEFFDEFGIIRQHLRGGANGSSVLPAVQTILVQPFNKPQGDIDEPIIHPDKKESLRGSKSADRNLAEALNANSETIEKPHTETIQEPNNEIIEPNKKRTQLHRGRKNISESNIQIMNGNPAKETINDSAVF